MASSWGDGRTSYRFGRTELWVPRDDFDTMVAETQKLVERLETVRELVTPPEAVTQPALAIPA